MSLLKGLSLERTAVFDFVWLTLSSIWFTGDCWSSVAEGCKKVRLGKVFFSSQAATDL